MKYLEDPRLAHYTNLLSDFEMGDVVLDGRIEAFSCKRAGDDKRLSRRLDQQLKQEFATSPKSPAESPLGPLTESSTRNLLIDLIITMNASFPDYDFSSLRPEQFLRESHLDFVVNVINTHLANVDEFRIGSPADVGEKKFLVDVWKTAEEIIKLRECEVYRYIPDLDDPFSEGSLWSFNYFFFNKALKRIIFFTCIARSKLFSSVDDEDEELDSDFGDEQNETDMDMEDDFYTIRQDWEEGS